MADRLRHASSLLELERKLFENEAFANESESCFALVTHYPYGPFATFTDYDPAFFKQMLRRYPQLELSFDLPPGTHLQIKRTRGLKQSIAPRECFSYEGDPPAAPVDPHIRLLVKEEFDLVRPIAEYQDDINYAKEIFIWHDGAQIAGYLCCSPSIDGVDGFDDIWDVNNIFVLPTHRNKGIGAALAYAYLKTMRGRGLALCYSGVTNPFSAAAARKAGFQLCCTRYAFKYQKPVIFS